MSIYVDDFKLVGKLENRKKGWKLIRQEIDLDDPTPFGDYLGCGQFSMPYQSKIHDAKYDLFLHFSIEVARLRRKVIHSFLLSTGMLKVTRTA